MCTLKCMWENSPRAGLQVRVGEKLEKPQEFTQQPGGGWDENLNNDTQQFLQLKPHKLSIGLR